MINRTEEHYHTIHGIDVSLAEYDALVDLPKRSITRDDVLKIKKQFGGA